MGKYRFHRQRYGEILIGRLKRMHQAGKTEFVNNNFYNVQDGKSSQVQRSSDGKKQMTLTGVKVLELEETFNEMLFSPKVEVLLPRGYTECEVTGNYSRRKNDFEYSLTVSLSNPNDMTL